MTRNFSDVGLFHEKFGLDNVNFHGAGPRELPPELLEFRRKFLHEELEEFEQGIRQDDVAQMADALVDLVYVAMGTAHLLGLPWEVLWADVQRANMAKVRAQADGSNSARGSAYDVVKPEGWEPPHTQQILSAYLFDQPRRLSPRDENGVCLECGVGPESYHLDSCTSPLSA